MGGILDPVPRSILDFCQEVFVNPQLALFFIDNEPEVFVQFTGFL